MPYLERALAASPCELVFPDDNGKPFERDTDLSPVLRRAMGVAGIATGWRHFCRKHHCGHVEKAPDAEPRFCPKHPTRQLCVAPVVRPIRFYDLRHTTASLLLQAGVPLQAVQAIMRHRDPKLTMRVYGHLSPSYLRGEVNRLPFALPSTTPPAPETEPARVAGGGETENLATPFATLPPHEVPEAAGTLVESLRDSACLPGRREWCRTTDLYRVKVALYR